MGLHIRLAWTGIHIGNAASGTAAVSLVSPMMSVSSAQPTSTAAATNPAMQAIKNGFQVIILCTPVMIHRPKLTARADVAAAGRVRFIPGGDRTDLRSVNTNGPERVLAQAGKPAHGFASTMPSPDDMPDSGCDRGCTGKYVSTQSAPPLNPVIGRIEKHLASSLIYGHWYRGLGGRPERSCELLPLHPRWRTSQRRSPLCKVGQI